jgi:hypothetical protein
MRNEIMMPLSLFWKIVIGIFAGIVIVAVGIYAAVWWMFYGW